MLTRTLIWKNLYDSVYTGTSPSSKFIDVFCRHIAGEKSDGNFENQFENAYAAINVYTPRKYRVEMNTRIFYFILNLIPQIDSKQENRLIVLRQKLCEFASAEVAVKILLAWRQGKYEPLKAHQITLGQEWITVKKAFGQKHISQEEKQALLEDQVKKDSSDEGNLQKAICDSMKANKEEFEKIYNDLKDPKNERSVTLKRHIAMGWNHPYHSETLK